MANFQMATMAALVSILLTESATFAQSNQLSDYLEKSFACEKVGDKNGAEANFAKALALEKHSYVAYTARAIRRFEGGDRQGAFADIDHAIKICAVDSKSLRVRAHFKAQIGDNSGALKDYAESLRYGGKTSKTYMGRGILYLSMEDPQSAYADFEQALKIDPNNLLARFHRMCLTENKTQALADYQYIIATTPLDAQDHVIIGNAYVQFDETEKGEREFSKAIQLSPGYAQAYYNRAVIEVQKGEMNDALNDYNRAIESNASYAKAYFNRGLLKFSLDDHDGGMSDVKQAIELDPDLSRRAQDKPFEVKTS